MNDTKIGHYRFSNIVLILPARSFSEPVFLLSPTQKNTTQERPQLRYPHVPVGIIPPAVVKQALEGRQIIGSDETSPEMATDYRQG